MQRNQKASLSNYQDLCIQEWLEHRDEYLGPDWRMYSDWKGAQAAAAFFFSREFAPKYNIQTTLSPGPGSISLAESFARTMAGHENVASVHTELLMTKLCPGFKAETIRSSHPNPRR